jgi:hypothetical protein
VRHTILSTVDPGDVAGEGRAYVVSGVDAEDTEAPSLSVLLSEKALALDSNKVEPGGARPGAGEGACGRDVRGASHVVARMQACAEVARPPR